MDPADPESPFLEPATDDDDGDSVAGESASTRTGVGPRLSGGVGEISPVSPGTQIGRYVVVDVVGRGAMGVVWKAYDPQLDRNVALKRVRVRAGVDVATARDRLLREAQSLAQLSHPNVVAVHDVVVLGGDVFVAMELVVGQTLRDWLPVHRDNVWRIVAVFLEAGEGLAAAHRAGLVHRDFKPDNVILGQDGRARVLDFGLARATEGATPRAEGPPPAESPWSNETSPEVPATGPSPQPGSRRGSSGRLTAQGTIVGTPRYMAPEQHRSATTDARSDQFSFCVALYEAFFDARPFAGSTAHELRDDVLTGRVVPPPSNTKVPARWRLAVMRGLATDPQARFPSMEALLTELRRDPRVARRRALVAIGGVGLAALAAAALLWPRGRGPDCRVRDRGVDGFWNETARGRLRVAFAATSRVYAADVLARTEPQVDRFVRDWQAMRIDTCEATYVRGEQSTALLDQRMSCLDRKLEQMSELIAVLGAQPTAELVERAVQVVTDLGDVSTCSRRQQLAGPPPVRLEPAAQATLVRVLRTIDRAELFAQTGGYADGLVLARQAVIDVRAIDVPQTLGNALRVRGVLEERNGAYAAAEVSLQEALRVAAVAGDQRSAAQSWLELVAVTNDHEERLERAVAYLEAAEVAIGFLDGAAQVVPRLSLLTRRGLVRVKRSELDLAKRDLEDAAAATASLYGDGDYRTGGALVNLGLVLMKRGEYVTAEAVLGRATQVYERSLGPGHPLLSSPLVNLAGVLTYQRKLAKAEAMYRRALAIDESALGRDHPFVADGKTNLGGVLLSQGQTDEARRHFEEALALQERVHGKDHPDVAFALAGLSAALTEVGQFDESRALLARALAIHTARSGPDSESVAQLREMVGASYLAEHKYGEAYRELGAAAGRFERLLGADHARNAIVLGELVEAAVGMGRDAEAVRLGERALGLMDRPEAAVAESAKAWVRFLLAKARDRLGIDRRGQIDVARAAAAALGSDLTDRRRRATIDAWLAIHP